MKRRILRCSLLAILAGLLATGGTVAVVRTVDDDPGADYTAVQLAIDASISGDDVLVACGSYEENIVMKKGVDVIGAGADCTILDGTMSGTVVTFNNVNTPTLLEGFTIRNGLSQKGGGIFLRRSDPTISHNIISGNASVRNLGGYYGYGGGMHAYESDPTITSNVFIGNTAERTGAAIDMYFSYPVVMNNTIVGNDAAQPGAGFAYGGGIYGLFSGPTISSNVIYNNTSEGGGAGIDMVNSGYIVEYNDLFQNVPLNWFCVDMLMPCTNPVFPFGPGNVQLDPLLGADLCPRSHSPAIDTGDPLSPAEPSDLHGRPRVMDGDFDGTAIVDMGSCETDEVTMLTMGPGDLIAWDPSVNGSAVYNLYRGLLSVFSASCATTCVYSQDPLLVLEARQQCDLLSPSFTDLDVPPVDDAYYYLVTGEHSAEGGLGWLGPAARPHDNPCP